MLKLLSSRHARFLHACVLLGSGLLAGCGTPGAPRELSADVQSSAAPDTPVSRVVAKRPTVPVFYPWSGTGHGPGRNQSCGRDAYWFDCDTPETPYGLVWTSQGWVQDIASTQADVSPWLERRMQQDDDTLYLVADEWHYYYPRWRELSEGSPFYLDERFKAHDNSEYNKALMINFEHPQWPGVLAEKAQNYRQAGFDGMLFDWWHDGAGNGRSKKRVRDARLAIAKAIREQVGDDFVLMGNVNWNTKDPTASYLSGVFLELYKTPGRGYTSGEMARMESLVEYWDQHLAYPKIVAFEPWKVTRGDFIDSRASEQNIAYAKLYAAMVLVVAENGYFLYADNNQDWDLGDHQHAYYDFYHTDFGKPISGRVQVKRGVGYKRFEHGLVAYNRNRWSATFEVEGYGSVTVAGREGRFIPAGSSPAG